MLTQRPEKLIDPVCGMTVRVAIAEGDGLLLEYEGRTYAFCSEGCRNSFVSAPASYSADDRVSATVASPAVTPAVIDEGMRRWYESCSCCLSEAYPEVKAQLDAERAAALQPAVDPGICEVAEAEVAHAH